jgi:antitoxin HigA-1
MAEHQVTKRPKRAPTQPGEILREDVLPRLNRSVSAVARQLRVTRQSLPCGLAGRAAITPEMAVRLGNFCGDGPALWLHMQQAHDLWHAERRLRAEGARIPTAAA